MPLGNWSEAITYPILKEVLKKSTTRWFRLNYLVFAAAGFKAQVENTSTSKAEGIDRAPQLWALPPLKVRIMNELLVSASAGSPDEDYLPLERSRIWSDTLRGQLSRILSYCLPRFLFHLLFMSFTLTQGLWTALRKKRGLAGTTCSVLYHSAVLRRLLKSLDFFLLPFQWGTQHSGRKV